MGRSKVSIAKKKKDLTGLIPEALQAESKKIMGNGGRKDTRRDNKQGSPTSC